jgi:pimeloyl-ACP methyl ester carboxylesterase/predicted acylesterase/phospholipase RssA
MARIGLVLGAGGATGHAFHIGVLAALEEATGWDPREAEIIVGTSAGAIIGALLRTGLAPRDLAARALGRPLSPEGERVAAVLGRPTSAPPPDRAGLSAFFMAAPELVLRMARRPWDARLGALVAAALPPGRVSTDHLVGGIRRAFPAEWPARRLWVTAVRLDDGRRVVLGRDPQTSPDVATAVAASCAVPGYYQPVTIDGVRHVDGGVHSPTNADLLADQDLDLVIVSSPMSAKIEIVRPSIDLPVRGFCHTLLRREIAVLRHAHTSTLAFEPSRADRRLMGVGTLDTARRHAVIQQARESALGRLAHRDLRYRLDALGTVARPRRVLTRQRPEPVSRIAELGVPVHFIDYGGTGPTMVLVHGLGGAHVNWMAVGSELTRHARVLALDLAGFGRTPTEGRSASIHANRALLSRFITKVAGGPVILMGNSMGGLISLMQASEEPASVAGLVLVDAALPPPRSTSSDLLGGLTFAASFLPGVGELVVHGRKALFGPEGSVRHTLELCCVDVSRIAPEIMQATMALSRERLDVAGGNAAFLEAARSLVAFLARRRAFQAMVRAITAPTLVLHGAEDRLVPLASARALLQLRPEWPLHVFPDIGHVPQLEDPAGFMSAVEGWLDGEGYAAVQASRRATGA